jgi:hypothetical protein
MTREEMIQKINEMSIYEEDYKVIRALLEVDDRFFVKVIEEILSGNISFSDFTRIFSDDIYSSLLEKNLESQQKLKTELDRILQFRRIASNNPSLSIDPDTTMIGITIPPENTRMEGFYNELKEETIDNQIFQILESIPTDSELVKASKIKIYNGLKQGLISKEDFLLFARDYIVPISSDYQILDSTDINFMVENGITEEQMKKIKALTNFIKRKEY